jgi:hypothetical protein
LLFRVVFVFVVIFDADVVGYLPSETVRVSLKTTQYRIPREEICPYLIPPQTCGLRFPYGVNADRKHFF